MRPSFTCYASILIDHLLDIIFIFITLIKRGLEEVSFIY
jgi:hypothetical protein